MSKKIKLTLLANIFFFGAVILLSAGPILYCINGKSSESVRDETAFERYKKYKDQETGFSFQYPADWEEDFGLWGATITFKSSEAVLPKIAVSVGEYAADEWDLNSTTDAVLMELRDQYESFWEVERVSSSLSGFDAEKITFTIEDFGQMIRVTLVICLYKKQDKAFFVYFLEDGEKKSAKKVLSYLLNSFRIFPGSARYVSGLAAL